MGKLNKKGFTLVEILGVIVILSILVLLITSGILGYFKKGKEDYNDKLKGQLVLAGKSYYSEHDNELPVLNGQNYSYITLPEMQSNNYITKSFVDSEGRECSPSYVYVKPKAPNTKEYDYIPCLICQDKNGNKVNYSDSESYCNISNWKNIEPATCNQKPEKDYTDMTAGDWKLTGVEGENITTIIIRNKETGTAAMINVSGKTIAEIQNIDLKNQFDKKFASTKNGNYEVILYNDGPTESQPCITISKFKNECSGVISGNNVVITYASAKYGIKAFYSGAEKEEKRFSNNPKEVRNQKLDNISPDDEVYFRDTKNQKTVCSLLSSGIPKCKFTKESTKLLKIGETVDLEAECYLSCLDEKCGNVEVTNHDSSGKIKSGLKTNGIGTVSGVSDPISSRGELIKLKLKYTPTTGKGGNDTVTIDEGTVRNPNAINRVNKAISTNVSSDAIAPVCTYKEATNDSNDQDLKLVGVKDMISNTQTGPIGTIKITRKKDGTVKTIDTKNLTYSQIMNINMKSKAKELFGSLTLQEEFNIKIVDAVGNESSNCMKLTFDDKINPTCTFKQITNYTDNNSFYLSNVKDMITRTEQGSINAIKIKRLKNGDEYTINTAGQTYNQIQSINIKQKAREHFGATSGEEFQVKVVDAVGNESSNCMTFHTCLELDNKTYSGSITYGGATWTVARDNGGNVGLALNGTFGYGGYANSYSYLDTYYLNANQILKDAKTYGCLVDQGTNQYISSNPGTADGYTGTNYWINSGSFYNNNTKNRFSSYYVPYAAGYSGVRSSSEYSDTSLFNRLIIRNIYNGDLSSTPIATPGVLSTSSTGNYYVDTSNGTITFYNAAWERLSYIEGSTYWARYIMEIVMKQSANYTTANQNAVDDGNSTGAVNCNTSSDGKIICYHRYKYRIEGDGLGNYSYNLSPDGVELKFNPGDKLHKFQSNICGGSSHGTGILVQSSGDASKFQYKLTGAENYENKNYITSDGYMHFVFASTNPLVSCGSGSYCSVSENGYQTKTFALNSDTYCKTHTYFNLKNVTENLSYRPYIVVKKEK